MTIRETRGLFARCLLGACDVEPVSIGSIVLRRHQQTAVTRVNAAIGEFGGALVSDHVGTGKTYVALAVAAKCTETTVVAPAVLEDMWLKAASKADVSISFVSTESLSRHATPMPGRNVSVARRLVIVDEAQHFRNPATRRFASLAHLCSERVVILLSATPIHNRKRDLQTLLSLFIGSRAARLSPSELGRIVIRRSRDHIAGSAFMPEVVVPQWCDLTHDDEVPELLLALPPPLSPRDGGDGGALVVHSLIRQWVSSDRALHRALVRRLQKATALMTALESGTYPSESELTSWISGEDCVQLGFPALLSPADAASAVLLPIVRRHVSALEALARRLKASNARDLERAGVIRELRRKHKGIGIVAFSQYADTVEGLFELLAHDGAAALLTGGGARVSGGRISRAEAIARFAPQASGNRTPRPAEAVTLLLATDILSEGVNLQDAGVVIHLDLPWTPARMEQRLGRVARMGSRHERVFSYVMRPPASADALIRTESILRTKMVSAGVVTDGLQSILPGPFTTSHEDNLPRVVEELRSILEQWANDVPERAHGELVTSAITAHKSGFVALCRRGVRYGIISRDSSGVTDDPARVIAMMRCANGEETDLLRSDLADAVNSARRYLRAIRAVDSTSSQDRLRESPQRRALRRIARIANCARPHERSYILPASSRARATVLGRLSAGQEAQLAALSAAKLSDIDWLREVAALSSDVCADSDADEIVAMIVFRTPSLSKRDSGNKTLSRCL